MLHRLSCICFLFLIVISCNEKKAYTKIKESVEKVDMIEENWGTMTNGNQVARYVMRNNNEVEVAILTFGGIVQSIKVPDNKGQLVDVALGFDNIASYEAKHPYFGGIIGRYGNRIAKGKFEIEGRTYELATNNNENHLHGGLKGFDKVMWNAKPMGHNQLELSYNSTDMEEGYPGNLNIVVTYQLTEENELVIRYNARTDKTTHVNLTNHSYFNLNGSGDILNHELVLRATRYTPVDKTLIPIGEKAPVVNTPFDFTTAKSIGKEIDDNHEQIQIGGGYDHNYILDNPSLDVPFALLASEKSGIVMEAFTTEPGVQFYSGNFLDGSLIGKSKNIYNKRNGICLETQHFPDSPNQPSFPSTLLTPDQTYESTTVYKFGVSK